MVRTIICVFPQGALFYTAPRLSLACGVTTIQTCGTGNPYEEIEIAKAIANWQEPGTEIINSGPYLTGPEGKQNFIRFFDEQTVRDTIQYWANRGVKWFKAYRHTRPDDLKIIIDEAHKYGTKVTGHLCATTYEEAAKLGIDAIEHGFIHSYDYAEGKEKDVCGGSRDFRSELDIHSEEVKRVHQILIKNNVGLSSTLAIFETQARGIADQRDLDAMAPFHRAAYENWRKRKLDKGKDWYFKEEWLQKSMEYDLAFYRAGGLLTAGPDPGLHNLPGYGDQKNYELFIEAGFKPEEAIQVMTSNGAKLLGREDIGTIAVGKRANLVLLNGNLEENPNVIRHVELVFKDGKGFDPEKLIDDVLDHVGSESDEDMTYLGRKKPGKEPQIFAPDFISKKDEYEFGSVFSRDGKEFFYGVDLGGKAEIRYISLNQGVWSIPKVILSDSIYGFNDPFLSPDEKRLYYISKMPKDSENEAIDHDIWYSEKTNNGWSSPINAGPNINTDQNEYYISFTQDGSMYFSSNSQATEGQNGNFDIYTSQNINGEFQQPIRLSDAINSEEYEADVFIAPDESYLIFCSIRNEGLGQGDLYISFKMDNGSWSKAKNMKEINTESHELCPFVSSDGKYFFYTSDRDIYWVNTEVFEQFKPEF